jgi:diguanylate cyclase (GGDEF)-like protein
MKPEGVLAWVLGDGDRPSAFACATLPFAVVPVREPDAESMVRRLTHESHDVLCVEDAPPFSRIRDLLRLTDTLAIRPVMIVVAPDIDVPSAVELMECGVFSVISDVADCRRLAAAVNRAFETRRAFEKIVNMSRSLERSRTFLEKKSVALTAERVKFRRKSSEVSIMRRVAEWLGRAKSLEEGLSEVLTPLAAFIGAEHGVFLVNPEKGRWVVSGRATVQAEAAAFPRASGLFRRAGQVSVSPSGVLTVSPAGRPDGEQPGIAIPVRIKRRFLGYGVFWGPEVAEPAHDTLRLLEAVGVQVGAFCEGIVLREQVATERDLLGHAKDEINFQFQFASVLNEDPDLDAVFLWLCRELGRFVPYASIEFFSRLEKTELRACGVQGLLDGKGRATAELIRRWRRHFPAAFETASGEAVAVKEFPYGDASRDTEDAHLWVSQLAFGDKPLGAFAVRTPRQAPHSIAAERVLKSVTAQLSLFLHNFAEREKVRIMASNDGLTGLYNYRSFQDLFDREFEWYLRRGRNLTLLMIDVDHFKGINDTFGHQLGDQVLKGVADILQHNLRKTDYAFRYGGDEFVVMMPDAGIRQAEVFAQRVRSAVRATLQGVPPDEYRVTLSIGVADCGCLTSREQEELLKRADGALYQAKARGRDRVQVAEPTTDAKRVKEVRRADPA